MSKHIHINTALLEACVNDDRKAIEKLYEISFKMFMPTCCRYHHNEEDARSSFNLAFMKILRSLESVYENVNFIPWAKRIIVNTLIDEYRKNNLQNTHYLKKETDRELDVEAENISNDAESSMGYENLLLLISTLPEISQKVFNLYVIDGYNHREIGDLLGISEGTSKWHLSTARKILKEKLEKMENTHQKLVV